jgi:EF hand
MILLFEDKSAMNRIVLGAFGALLLVSAGLFWWQGRAATEQGAPPPALSEPADEQPDESDDPDILPSEAGSGQLGPALPEVSEPGREEQRFNRLDRDHDGRIARIEMLGPRVPAFRKLDRDGNNLLSFEEWAVATSNRFKGADANGDSSLTRQEFASTRPRDAAQPQCRCR